jgi:hypothetical protein
MQDLDTVSRTQAGRKHADRAYRICVHACRKDEHPYHFCRHSCRQVISTVETTIRYDAQAGRAFRQIGPEALAGRTINKQNTRARSGNSYAGYTQERYTVYRQSDTRQAVHTGGQTGHIQASRQDTQVGRTHWQEDTQADKTDRKKFT